MGNSYAAIVDFGMGNLFSVKQACEASGITARITSEPNEVHQAGAVILPGVGAFGQAMTALRERGLIEPVKKHIHDGKPFVGICLGLQLLFTESAEFGAHQGLGIIPGKVVRFPNTGREGQRLKVPHVGWNRIYSTEGHMLDFENSLLKGADPEAYMYFVHSFYVEPQDASVVLSRTNYGGWEFCSSIQYQNIFACQFHPERSGENGLSIYRNLKQWIEHPLPSQGTHANPR